MRIRTMLTALGAAALLLPTGAFAQDDMDQPDVVVVDGQDQRNEVQDRGLEVQALGGVRSFTGEAGDFLATGPAYGVAVAIEPFPLIALELSYQGASFLTDEGLPGDQNRVNQNGGAAAIKLSPIIGRVEPYAFGGFGLSQLRATGAGNVFVETDTLYSIPVGVGIDFHLPVGVATDVLLGVRGTYEFGYGEDAFSGITDERTDWLQGTVNAGFQF